MSISGDNLALSLNRVNYRVSADSDFDRKPRNEKEVESTSGDPNIIIKKTNENIEGVMITVDGAERENLLDLDNTVAPFPFSYTDGASNSYTGECLITIVSDNTQNGKIGITIIPTKKPVAIIV